MTKTRLAAAGAAAFAFILSGSPSHAGYFLPGETMGVSLASPVPEGVYLADLETYGRADKQPDANVGVNIPVILWSTPWTLASNRLELLAAFPFAHFDTRTGVAGVDGNLNFAGASSFSFGPILGHDFGNGLSGGIAVFARSPSASAVLRRVDGRTIAEGDVRQSLKYVVPSGLLRGVVFMENGAVSSALGQSYSGPQPGIGPIVPFAKNDTFAGDFTIEQKLDKLTIGFTGFGNIDLDNRGGGRQASVELGGLIGYDFGRFSLTGIVTRTVYENATGISAMVAGTISREGYETRGWLRVVVPVPVASPADAVLARD